MPRLLEVLLHVDFVVAEGGLRLGPCGAEGDLKLLRVFATFIPRPPPPRRGLDDDGIADLLGRLQRRLDIRHAAIGPRHHRDAQRFRGSLRGDLVAHDADVFRIRADEGQPVVFQRLREGGIFDRKP